MTSTFSKLNTVRVSSVAKNLPLRPLGELGGLAVQQRFSKSKWKVWWKGGGKMSPVSGGKNRRKSWQVLSSDLETREAFFHSEKFAVENLEKQDARTKPPSRPEKQKFFRPVDLGICRSTYG
jgi:hypothetical protein